MKFPRSVSVGLNLPFLQVSGTWEPNDAERMAAWELYVELMTRVTVVPLEANQGLLREALNGHYSIFATTREILRRHGPTLAEPKSDGAYNFGFLALMMLNNILRPELARWHPVLEDWEIRRPLDRSRMEHEADWDLAAELRKEIMATRERLTEFSALMAAACGIPSLSDALLPPVERL